MNVPSKFDPRGPLPEKPSNRARKPLSAILQNYRVTPTGCWEWAGARNLRGYGVVGLFLGGRSKGIPAPRLQWMHSCGEIPPDGVIMHICDNPPCINPDHLQLGTAQTNLADMRAKGRHNYSGLKNVGTTA